MKKQTKVLLAAALFTLGASFSAMAADVNKKGEWVLSEDGWMYVDKEGDYVEEEWCSSYGTTYWVDEDGYLGASEWVNDEDGYTYYVQSDGSMTKNAWKYIYAEDEEDDTDAEEHWFYFDSKGRMVNNKYKYQIGDYYYTFDSEGKMLTGWVDVRKKSDGTYEGLEELAEETSDLAPAEVAYHDPESGALVRYSWVNVFPWTMDEDDCYEGDDSDYDDGDDWYYYLSGDGKPYTNQIKKINGHYYAFDKEGKMIEEWVVKLPETYNTDGTVKTYVYTGANATSDDEKHAQAVELYYATSNVGNIKVNKWYELTDFNDDTNWFYFDKLGKAFMSTSANADSITNNAYRLELVNGEALDMTYGPDLAESDDNSSVDTSVYVETKKIDGTYYYFDQYGAMLDGLVMIDDKLMYLEDGARKTGKVSIEDDNENEYTFCFADETDSTEGYEKYVAVTGNMNGYLYHNGQLVTSSDDDIYREYTVTNNDVSATFIVNHLGKIQHKDGKEYDLGTEEKAYTFNTTNEGWNEDCVKPATTN